MIGARVVLCAAAFGGSLAFAAFCLINGSFAAAFVSAFAAVVLFSAMFIASQTEKLRKEARARRQRRGW